MALPIIATGVGGLLTYFIGKKYEEDMINEAVIKGEEAAAQQYEPVLKDIKESFAFYSELLDADLERLSNTVKGLRKRLKDLCERYDLNLTKIENMTKNLNQNDYSPIGNKANIDEGLDNLVEFADVLGYDPEEIKEYLKGKDIVFMPCAVCTMFDINVKEMIFGKLLYAIFRDYDKYFLQSYKYHEALWRSRIGKELDKIFKMHICGQRLNSDANNEKNRLLNEIKVAALFINDLKTRNLELEYLRGLNDGR